MASSGGPRAGRMRNRRWRLGPSLPSPREMRLTALGVGYCLIEMSLPGDMWGVLSMFVVLAVGLAFLLLGAVWLVRLLVTVIDDPRNLRSRTWTWLVQPALIGILLFSWAYDLPLMARVKMSEGALIRSIESAEEFSGNRRYVGLVWVEHQQPPGWWGLEGRGGDGARTVRLRTGSAFIDTCGLIYAPGMDALSSYGDFSVWPLYGPWWRYHLRF